MSAIEERIRKLLALADSPNENEAAAAAEKAQALMLRYGIEMATIAASGGERLAVDEHVVDGKVDPWRRMLAAAVARSAGGQVVWAPDSYRRSQGTIFFYGPAGAVGGMVELYRYLEAQLVVISATATAARQGAARARAHVAQLIPARRGRSSWAATRRSPRRSRRGRREQPRACVGQDGC